MDRRSDEYNKAMRAKIIAHNLKTHKATRTMNSLVAKRRTQSKKGKANG